MKSSSPMGRRNNLRKRRNRQNEIIAPNQEERNNLRKKRNRQNEIITPNEAAGGTICGNEGTGSYLVIRKVATGRKPLFRESKKTKK